MPDTDNKINAEAAKLQAETAYIARKKRYYLLIQYSWMITIIIVGCIVD